jgi:hypothetical protein
MLKNIKNYNQILYICIIVAISALIISCSSKGKKNNFMLSAVAKQATVKKTNFNYELVILKKNISSVVVFADRPKRNVNNINVAQLEKLWKKGANSFTKNPPNAVLSGKSYPTTIVEITGMVVHSNDVHFQIRAIDGSSIKTVNNIQNVVLTIDNTGKKITKKSTTNPIALEVGNEKA